MKRIKITVMRITCYQDLIDKFENPIEHACDMKLGQVFIANGYQKPEGFCDSAWDSIAPFVISLRFCRLESVERYSQHIIAMII